MHPHARPKSLLADLRELPRTFWILFVGTFINRFGTFVRPFLTIYLTRRGHSLTAASLAVSAFGVGALVGGLLGGRLADHFGRRNTIVLGTFTSAAAFMLLYTAVSLPAIVACTLLAGFTSGIYQPAIGALLADIVPPAQRVRAYAAIRAAANAGFACGAATGGVLAKFSLFWLFAGDALTTALYGCIAFLWLPQGLRVVREKSARWNEALRHIVRDRAFLALWTSAFLASPTGLEWMSELGADRVRSYNHRLAWNGAHLLADRWGTRFTPPESMIGTMATVPLPERAGSTSEEGYRLRAALHDHDHIEVQLHPARGRLWVRISAQIYNEEGDMIRLADAVLARSGR